MLGAPAVLSGRRASEPCPHFQIFPITLMSKNLVIVESPAKAKTIKKYLGKDFEVLASYGHVRDLVPKEGAVDPAHDFAMKYQVIDKNERHVEAIVKAIDKADALYLAERARHRDEQVSFQEAIGQ